MNKYIDKTGRLTPLGLEIYVDAMRKDNIDDIPDLLYDHVQNSPKCLERVIFQYSRRKAPNKTPDAFRSPDQMRGNI